MSESGSERKEISAREAAEIAFDSFEKYQEFMGNPKDIRLESIERSTDDQYWIVTIGFTPEESSTSIRQYASGMIKDFKDIREYKKFEVNVNNGTVSPPQMYNRNS